MSTRSAPLPRKRINKNSLDDITNSPPPKRSVSASLGKREPPPVPIKTYLWEELRRARLLGGYPWTHLYKGQLDPDTDIVMDTSNIRRRRRRPENLTEQSAEASPPEDDSSETDGSTTRRRRRKPEIDKDQSVDISPSESDATEDPARRRRRRPESDSELTAEVTPSESTETDSSVRRRRRRPVTSQEPAATEKKDSDNITKQKLSEGLSEQVESEQTKDSITESPLNTSETGELVHSEEKTVKSSVHETEPISREEIYEIKERIQEDETKIIIILDDKNNPLKDETALPIPLEESIENTKPSENLEYYSRVLKDGSVYIPLSGVPTLEYDNIDKGLTAEKTDVTQEDPQKQLKTYSKILDDGSVYIPLSGEPVPDAETRLRTNIISETDKRLTPDRKDVEESSKAIKTYSRLMDDGSVYIPLTGEPVPDEETRLRTNIISETDKRLTPDRKNAEELSKDLKTYSRLLDDGTIYIPLAGEPVPDAETRLRTSIISETDKRLTPDRQNDEESSKDIKTYSRLMDDGSLYIPLKGEPVSEEELLKSKVYSEMTETDKEKENLSEKNIDEGKNNVILEPVYISGDDNKTDIEINISKSTISEPSSSELQKLVSELTDKSEIPTENVITSEKSIQSRLTPEKNTKDEKPILQSESPAKETDQFTGVALENEVEKKLEYFSKTLPDGTVYIPLKGVPEDSLLEKIEQSAKESICEEPSKTTNIKDLPDYTEIAENIRKEIEKEREEANKKIKYYSKVLDDGSIYIPLKGVPGNENEPTLVENGVDTIEKDIQDISATALEKTENEPTADIIVSEETAPPAAIIEKDIQDISATELEKTENEPTADVIASEEAAPPAAIIETVYISDTATSPDILSTEVIEPPEVQEGSLQQLVSDIIARDENVNTVEEPEAVPLTEIKDESPPESIEYFSKTLPDGTVYIPLKGVPDEDTLTAVERSAKEKLLSPATDNKIKKVPDFTDVTEEIRKELEQERQKTPQPEIQTYSKVLSDGSVYIPLKGVPADDVIDNFAATEKQLNGVSVSEGTKETKSTDVSASKRLTLEPQTDLLRRSKSKTPDFTELTEKIRKSIQEDRSGKEISKKGRKDQKFYSKVLDDGSIYIPLKGVPADTIEKSQLKTDDSIEKTKSDEKLNEIEQTEKDIETIIEPVKVEEKLQEPPKEEKNPEEDSIKKTKSNEKLNKTEQTEKNVEVTDEPVKVEEKLKEHPKEEEKQGKDSIKNTKSNEKLNKKEQAEKVVESINAEEKLQKSTKKEKNPQKDKNFDITKLTDTIRKSLQKRKVDNEERKQKYFSKVSDDESANIPSTGKSVDDVSLPQLTSKHEEPELVSSLPVAVLPNAGKEERPKTPVIDITALTESIRESLKKEQEEKKKKDLKFYSQVLDDGSIYIPLKGEPSDEIKLKAENTEQFVAENETIQKQQESVEMKPVFAEKPEKVDENQENKDTSTKQITETNVEDSVEKPQKEQNEALAKEKVAQVSTNTTVKKPSFKINLKALTEQIRRAEEEEKKAQLNYFSKVLDDGSIYIPLSGTPNPDVLERKHASYVEAVDENVDEKINNEADVQPAQTNTSTEERITVAEKPAVDLTKITDEIRDALLKEKAEKERKEKELTYFSKVLDDGTVYIPLKGVPIEEDKLQRSVKPEETELETEKVEIQKENEVKLSEYKVVPENKENEMQIKAPKEEDTKEKDIKIITDSKEPETTGIKRVDSHIYEPIENPDENKENINVSKKKKKPKSKSDKEDDETKKWTNTDDHEYEPINAPPEKVDARLGESRSDVSGSTTSLDRRFLRIPMDDEVVITPDSQDISMASGDATGAGSSVQDDRYLNMSPTTTESRTSDIHTSQVDSSALENLPLKRDSRNRASLGNNRNNIQQKIRSQAGRLKTKLKGIKKPNFDRPKFSMPKMPDRPKMSMPKMPKMPDRPKFTMPKMPERPKINFPSINLRRSKSDAATSSTQRPLRDRNVSSTESQAGSKKNLFDLNFRTYPRLLSRTKDKIKTDFFKEEKDTETQAAPPAAPKRPDTPPPAFWWQTIQRSSKRRGPPGTNWKRKSGIQGQEDDDSRMSKEFDSDVEAERDAKINAASQRDDENVTGDVQQIFEAEKWDSSVRPVKIENLREAVMGAEETEANLQDAGDQEMEIDNAQQDAQLSKHDANKRSGSFLTNQEERSSGSSSERHRRGVLEEIDSDEFFLREKGISQDNIDVGLYLSNEIREAFRAPVNALSQMTEIQPPDYNQEMQPPEYYDEEYVEEDISERAEPERPKRKRKRSERKKFGADKQGSFEHSITEDEQDSYNNYRTFPPARPRRKSSTKRQDSQEIKPEVTAAERALGDSQQLEYIDYCSEIDDIRKDFELKKNIENLERDDETGQQIERTNDIPPMPPKRKQKSLRSLTLSEHDSFMKENFGHLRGSEELIIHRIEHEYIVPDDGSSSMPIAPKRTRSKSRSRSRGSRATSAADEDRTSHGAESLVSEAPTPYCEELPSDLQDDSIGDMFGYASVEKKEAQPKPPPPRKKKRKRGETQFFTVPRPLKDSSPPPVRPVRNYSTLGPSRPTRKKSVSSIKMNSEEKENIPSDSTQYVEIEDDEAPKRLQSGEVIEKMKSRPLPAPPRPPRIRRDKDSDDSVLKEILPDNKQQLDDEADEDKKPVDETIPAPTETIPVMREPEKMSSEQRSEKVRSLDLSEDICQSGIDTDFYPESTLTTTTLESRTELKESDDTDISPESKTLTQDSPTDVSKLAEEEQIVEVEMSTQTDPLPDDFCCEEVTAGPEDIIIAPTRRRRSSHRLAAAAIASAAQKASEQAGPQTTSTQSLSTISIKDRRTPTHIGDTDQTLVEAMMVVEPFSEFERSQSLAPDISEQTISEGSFTHPSRVFPLGIPPLPDQQTTLPPREQQEQLVTQSPVTLQQQPTISQQLPPPAADRDMSNISPQPHIVTHIIERQIPITVTPGPETEVEIIKAQRLQVADLDVERLTVSELLAQKILVSEIDGVGMKIQDLHSSGGNLVVNGIELPPEFIQGLAEQMQSFIQANQPPPPSISPQPPKPISESVGSQVSFEVHEMSTNTEQEKVAIAEEKPLQSAAPPVPDVEELQPLTPKPEPSPTSIPQQQPVSVQPEKPPQTPSIPIQLSDVLPGSPQMIQGIPYPVYYPDFRSVPPPSFYNLQSPRDESDEILQPAPVRRRRHFSHRASHSSSEEELRRSLPRSRRIVRTPDPGIPELSTQLVRACSTSAQRSLRQLITHITSHLSDEEGKQDVRSALIIIIVLIAGLILLGFGNSSKTVHHHHWDFLNPPDQHE